MFGAISKKNRTLDMQINFAILPNFHFRRWLGEFFSLFQSYEISITLSINSLGKSKTFQAFQTVPNLMSFIPFVNKPWGEYTYSLMRNIIEEVSG